MPRRIDLPGADELFRGKPKPAAAQPSAPGASETGVAVTGRIKHDEKITVYVSSDELVALEQLRLDLRARHGVAVDRGRIVRAAIAEALADVAEHGSTARLISRLTES